MTVESDEPLAPTEVLKREHDLRLKLSRELLQLQSLLSLKDDALKVALEYMELLRRANTSGNALTSVVHQRIAEAMFSKPVTIDDSRDATRS